MQFPRELQALIFNRSQKRPEKIWLLLATKLLLSSGLASNATEHAQPPAPKSSQQTKLMSTNNQEPFIPSSPDDPRLKIGTTYPPGSAMYKYEIQNRYSQALLAYAKKLTTTEKYKEALELVDRAWESEAQPSLDQAMDMHLALCMKLASQEIARLKEHYYKLALEDCEKGIAGWHGRDYYIPKIEALLGLNRKEEAVACCESAWRRAEGESQSTEAYSEYLQKLTGTKKPKTTQDAVRTEEIHQDLMAFLQCTSCLPQKDIEKRIGTSFKVLWPNTPHMIRREFSKGSRNYRGGSLHIPHELSAPSSLTLDPSPELGCLSEETVRKWLAPKEPIKEENPLTNSLIYEYPWGELEIAFSPFNSKSCYEWHFAWFKSSECDGLKDPFAGTQPTLEERLKTIDKLLEEKNTNRTFEEIARAVATATAYNRFPPKVEREAIASRLIRLKELEKKPEIVAYLKIAPFKELVTMTNMLQCSPKRKDFFTTKEYKAQKYLLRGKLDKDFNGQCEIIGFGGEPITVINEKTDAAERLFRLLNVKLPLDFIGKPGMEFRLLKSALLDQIGEEQEAIVSKRVAQRNKLLNAKYDEDSKNPEIVKERERQARRKALDPTRYQMRDIMLEFNKRQK